MNERNVKAIAELWRQAVARLGSAQITNADAAAQFLAARGVLVPGALTDTEVFHLFFRDGMRTVDTTGAAPFGAQRQALERIAKGEGPESAAEAGQLDPE